MLRPSPNHGTQRLPNDDDDDDDDGGSTGSTLIGLVHMIHLMAMSRKHDMAEDSTRQGNLETAC